MAKVVIKGDGSKQSFDAMKLKRAIEKAAEEAGLPADEVVKAVESAAAGALTLAGGVEEIATAELKMKILADLDTSAPEISAAWRKYDTEKKRALNV